MKGRQTSEQRPVIAWQAAGVRSVAAYDESLIWTGGVTAARSAVHKSTRAYVREHMPESMLREEDRDV